MITAPAKAIITIKTFSYKIWFWVIAGSGFYDSKLPPNLVIIFEKQVGFNGKMMPSETAEHRNVAPFQKNRGGGAYLIKIANFDRLFFERI